MNIVWNLRLVIPVILGVSVLGTGNAIATETEPEIESLFVPSVESPTSETFESVVTKTLLSEIAQETNPTPALETTPNLETLLDNSTQLQTNHQFTAIDLMEQVTSISQLRDVQPTDWAFQALQSLVERYGCIAGYPDGTYRGNRALTRYEFAAGLNACLDRINELIAAATTNSVTQEDLLALQRLQEEFAAELATLRGRVDALEARTAELEANQFSTTTKLSGLAFFHLTGAFANGDVRREVGQRVAVGSSDRVVEIADDANITYSGLVWLNLNTSFTGRDQLVTQLAVGNGNSPANVYASAGLFNTFGVPFVEQGTDNNTVIVRELFYDFPVSNSLRLVVGPRVNWYRYFDNNAFTFFLNGAGSFNSSGGTQLNSVDRGAGAVALWDISRAFKLRLGYLGESTEFLPNPPFGTASNPNRGLFNATNTATVELTVSPSDRANFRFLYTRSNIQQVSGRVGGAISEPFYGIADDGFGGPIGDATADTFSFNFDWRIARYLGLFGRYAYGSTNIYPRTEQPDGEINAQSYQIGVAFPDLGRRGALGTISFLVPFDVLSGGRYLVSGGGNGGTQYEIEATYYLPLTPNIALVPAFYVIGNPNNFDNNSTVYVGNLRTQFSF